MSDKLLINGLPVNAVYTNEELRSISALRLKLDELRSSAGHRIIVFLAAPPAAGKSTLAAFVEGMTGYRWSLQSVGLDGFHYPNTYLKSHTLPGNSSVLLSSIKGSPETFDTAALSKKLKELKSGSKVLFPFYDRTIHDPVPDAVLIKADIILFEGNWLLLNEEPWSSIRQSADITIRLGPVGPAILRGRLIARKEAGGLNESAAKEWYENSDKTNIERFYRDSVAADISVIPGKAEKGLL